MLPVYEMPGAAPRREPRSRTIIIIKLRLPTGLELNNTGTECEVHDTDKGGKYN